MSFPSTSSEECSYSPSRIECPLSSTSSSRCFDIAAFYESHCHCCQHDDDGTLHLSTQIVLSKVCKLILDEDGCLQVARQTILFNHYFGLTKGQLIITDVTFLPLILEYLCQNLNNNHQNINNLICFFYICSNGPIIMKTSDLLVDYIEDLTNYFNSLGNCLILLDGLVDFQYNVINIIENICNVGVKNCVPSDIRIEALERSALTELLLDFLLIAPEELNNKVLFLMHQILVLSVQCARNLLKNRDSITHLVIFNSEIENNRMINQQKKELIIDILWLLLECEDKKTFSTLKPLPKVVLKALGSWFRYAVLHGSPASRNDILGVICRVLYNYENLEIAKTGILEDLFILCTLSECNVKDTWASKVKFKGTNEDVQFKKILLVTLAYMLKHSFTRLVARNYYSLENIAILLDPFNKSLKTKWSDSQKWDLLLYAVNLLPFFVPYFPEGYIKCGITGRFLFLIEYFSTKKIRSELVCCCVKTLHLLLLKHIIPVDHFRQLHAFEVLISLAKTILYKTMSTLFQVALSYTFCILKELCDDYYIQTKFHKDLIFISLTTLDRFLRPDKLDYKTDESLIIGAGSFIWSCINSAPEIRKLLIQKGLIYLVLDIIEVSPFPIQLLYTGMLADVALDVYCVVPFVTWRGKTEDVNILTLLCTLWRSQEKIKGVDRADNGCAVDTEQILKGRDQKRIDADINNCPPLLDLYGCMRPKVYAIITLLLREHYTATQKACDLYGLQLMNINLKNEITLKLIQYYEHIKRGEIWENMLCAIKKNNPGIYPAFINYIEMLVSRYYCWGVDVIQEQYILIRDDAHKAKNEEKDLYDKLINCLHERQSRTLNEMQYCLSTSDAQALNVFKENYITLLDKERKKLNYDMVDNVSIQKTHDLNVYIQLEKTGRYSRLSETK